MDLNKMVNDSLSELNENGYVEKLVKERLEKTIQDVVKDALDSWSGFGKGLKEQINKQLEFNLDTLDMPSYNHMIMNTIKDEIERTVHEEGVKNIQDQVQELLGTSKSEYKLSEIIKKMVDDEMDLEELSYEECKEITVHIEESNYGTTYIRFDPEEDVRPYSCKYMIALNEDGTVWRVEIGDTKFDNKVIMGGLYGMNAMLFKMYTRKAKIIIDDYETEFSNPEYN